MRAMPIHPPSKVVVVVMIMIMIMIMIVIVIVVVVVVVAAVLEAHAIDIYWLLDADGRGKARIDAIEQRRIVECELSAAAARSGRDHAREAGVDMNCAGAGAAGGRMVRRAHGVHGRSAGGRQRRGTDCGDRRKSEDRYLRKGSLGALLGSIRSFVGRPPAEVHRAPPLVRGPSETPTRVPGPKHPPRGAPYRPQSPLK